MIVFGLVLMFDVVVFGFVIVLFVVMVFMFVIVLSVILGLFFDLLYLLWVIDVGVFFM